MKYYVFEKATTGEIREITHDEAKEYLARDYVEKVCTFDEMLAHEGTIPCRFRDISVIKSETNGERVKTLRTSLKMSRARFSEHFGIPARTIDDWENERREPSGYVVDMLIKLAASEKTIPTTWARVEWRDGYGDGSTEYFLDRDEAIREAMTEWNAMTEHDQSRRDAFFVGLYAMEWDDTDEEYVTTGDPIVIAWDALKK